MALRINQNEFQFTESMNIHVQQQGTTRRDSKLTKEEFIDQNVSRTVFLLLEEVRPAITVLVPIALLSTWSAKGKVHFCIFVSYRPTMDNLLNLSFNN